MISPDSRRKMRKFKYKARQFFLKYLTDNELLALFDCDQSSTIPHCQQSELIRLNTENF